MSLEYQRLNMVAQLGSSDPSVLEQQQQLALAEQQNVGAGAEQTIGANTGGNPSPAMAFARTPSQSTMAVEADEMLSDDSLTVSPDGKKDGARVGPAREV